MPVIYVNAELDPERHWAPALRALDPEVEVRWGEHPGDPSEIDLAAVWKPPRQGFAGMTGLRAIQSLGAGVDQLDPARLPAGVPLARLVDPLLTTGMVEYCRYAVLRYHREFDAYARDQAGRRWQPRRRRPPADTRVGILGLGELGSAIARDLVEAGFQVGGWSRRLKTLTGVACHAGAEGRFALAETSHILICVLPLTSSTEGILDAGLFARMPPGAWLVNIGRGRHLVEEDLIAAVRAGHLAGATLDVFRQEPLPEEHPFWSMPEITITPHIASTTVPETAARVVIENLRRALAGERLLYQVDLERGY